MLSWCLFLSDSLFSFPSWGIAPALYFGRITVKGLLLFFLPCIIIIFTYYIHINFQYFVFLLPLYLVCGFLRKSDSCYPFTVVVC